MPVQKAIGMDGADGDGMASDDRNNSTGVVFFFRTHASRGPRFVLRKLNGLTTSALRSWHGTILNYCCDETNFNPSALFAIDHLTRPAFVTPRSCQYELYFSPPSILSDGTATVSPDSWHTPALPVH